MHAKIKWYAAAGEHSQWKQNQGISMFQLCLNQGFPVSLVFKSLSGLDTDWAKKQPLHGYQFFLLKLPYFASFQYYESVKQTDGPYGHAVTRGRIEHQADSS